MSFYLDNEQRTYIRSDFSYHRDNSENITTLRLDGFPTLPNKTAIKKYLSWEKNRYVENCIFRDTQYFGAIAYYAIYGWTIAYNIVYFVNESDFITAENNPFFDEPKDREVKRTSIKF